MCVRLSISYLRCGEFVPQILGLHVDLAQFPAAQRVVSASFESTELFGLGHREVQLHQNGALAHEVLFEADDTSQEVFVFLVGAEPEDRFDHRPVVPTAVEQHHLAATRELGHVSLEIPLAALLSLGLPRATTR